MSSSAPLPVCLGLQKAFLEPVALEELNDDQDGEEESNMVESWAMQDALASEAETSDGPNSVLEGASKGVSENTYKAYIRLIKAFDIWLVKHKYIQAGETVFEEPVSDKAPEWIAMWIMDECDEIALDGSKKPSTQARSSYSHAMKMRAAATYGFGRRYSRGSTPWYITESGQWRGNPSISTQVSRYMVSLRRRKVRNGEAAISARAVNPALLKDIWEFNHCPENWIIHRYAPEPRLGQDLQRWGGGRTRRLLQAMYLLAFWCLLRFDEVLHIEMHHLEVISSTCIKLTLPFRKTEQFGEIKPFFLHFMHESDAYMCPVRALSEWIAVCGFETGYLFRRIFSGDRVDQTNHSMSSEQFLELFRNNLLDVGRDPWTYGTHSFRRGGCQWLSSGCRWPLRRICEWGGWSLDFTHLTIVKYLISWNDDPLECREDFLNPFRSPTVACFACGRSCHCA